MSKKNIISPYKKESPYSYTTGAYATIEMLLACPEQVEMVYIHSTYKGVEPLLQLCREKDVSFEFNDTVFKRISQKENIYVLGLFSKYQRILSHDAPHVVLVNPSDMGNLGTIIRTLVGFNILDLAIITPAADMWHPKTMRASMGALFRLNVELFSSFEQYRAHYDQHTLYPFMLDGMTHLTRENCPKCKQYSLIFGNEATGLPDCFKKMGTCVKLPISVMVDSLNLSVAVGVGAFLFASANGQIE